MLLSSAQKAANNDNLAEAEHCLKIASRWAINHAEPLLGRAHVARLSSDIDGCRRLLVMAENFGSPPELIRREQELLKLQSGAHASLSGNRSTLYQLALTDLESCEAVSKGLLVIGNSAAALAILDRQLELTPDAPRIVALKAKVLADTGREADALPLFAEAVARNQDLVCAQIGLADSLLATGSLPESLLHYDAAISRLSRFVEPMKVSATDADRLINCHVAKAHIMLQLKRHDEAIATLKPLVASYPENFAARYLLATVYSETGESRQVIDSILPVLGKFPHDVSLNYLLASAESLLGNVERSEQRMQTHLHGRAQLDELKKLELEARTQPPRAEICLRIAAGYLKYRWDEAEPWLERAYQLERDSPQVLLAWAAYYQKLGKAEQAARYREAALRAWSAVGFNERGRRE